MTSYPPMPRDVDNPVMASKTPHLDDAFYITGKNYSRRTTFVSLTCLIIIFGQAIWTLIMPVRNVALLPYPVFLEDGVARAKFPYTPPESSTTLSFTGEEVFDILNKTLQIVLDNPKVFALCKNEQQFVFEKFEPLLTNEEYEIITNFTIIYAQTSAFLATRFVPRKQTYNFTVPDYPPETNYTFECREEFSAVQAYRCTDPFGQPCAPFSPEDRPDNLTFVNLTQVYARGGMNYHNTFSLNYAVRTFYDSVNDLFQVSSWRDYLASGNRFPIIRKMPVFQNGIPITDRRIAIAEILTMPVAPTRLIYSCVLSDLLFVEVFLVPYLHYLMHTEIQKRPALGYDVYGWEGDGPKLREQIVRDLYRRNLYITSGVQKIYDGVNRTYFSKMMMTEKRASNVSIKYLPSTSREPSHPYQMLSALLVGGIYSLLNKTIIDDSTRQYEYAYVGTVWAGMYMGWGSWYANTRHHYPIRERPKNDAPENRVISRAIDEEQQIAQWFGTTFADPKTSLVQVITQQNLFQTRQCENALLYMLAQFSWLLHLSKAPVGTNLVFYSTMEGVTWPFTWYLNQMMQQEVLAQNYYGQMVKFPYDRPNNDVNASWPLIPLFGVYTSVNSENYFYTDMMRLLDIYYTRFLTFRRGALNLGIAQECALNNDLYGIDPSDNLGTVYDKIRPALENSIIGMITRARVLNKEFVTKFPTAVIPREFLRPLYNYQMQSTDGAALEHKFTSLSIGLMKLSTRNVPRARDIEKLKNYEHCYDVYENRFFTNMIRCVVQYEAYTQERTFKSSKRLRLLSAILYTSSIVLNIFTMYVACVVLIRIARTFQRTKFMDIPIELAMNVNLQAPGILQLNDVLIMTVSCLPVLVGYHLPENSEFIDIKSERNAVFREFLIGISLTWFIRLGVIFASYFGHVHYHNQWLSTMHTRVSYFVVVIVCLIRVRIKRTEGDYTRGMYILFGIILVVTFASFILTLVAKFFDKEPVDGANPLDKAFVALKLNRIDYGGLAQTPKGWSITGLLLEGWEPKKIRGHEQLMLNYPRKGFNLIFQEGDFQATRDRAYKVQDAHTMNVKVNPKQH